MGDDASPFITNLFLSQLDNLDINVSHINKLVFKIYNKTDDFNFEVVNFPFLENNIHSNITYSQLFRYTRIFSNYIDFKSRSQILSHKLIFMAKSMYLAINLATES